MPVLATIASDAGMRSESKLLASFDRARKLELLGPPRTARWPHTRQVTQHFEQLLATANTY